MRDDQAGDGNETGGLGRRQFLQSSTGVALAAFGSSAAAGSSVSGGTAESSVERQSVAAGDQLWTLETPTPVTASLTVVDETVYAATTGGAVSAIDAATGEQRWRYELDGRVDAAPVVVGDTVFVGDRAGTVTALTAGYGRVVWEHSLAGEIVASPTVRDGLLVVGDGSGVVRALDAWTGSGRWEFDAGGAVWSSATIVDGTAYVGTNAERVHAIDIESGTERWHTDTDGTVDSSPTVESGTVFVGSVDNSVYALDGQTGEKRWSVDTDDWVTATPTVAAGTVVAGSQDSTVYGLDTATGREQWAVDTDWAVTASPTVADGQAFVGSDDQRLYAIDASTGAVSWTYRAGGRIESSPVVVDGVVFVASTDGTVAALDAGVDGSSDGSRVTLGTLGHHHEWASVGDATALTLDNEESSAWTVTAIDGSGANAADRDNPTLKLRPGTRYTIRNDGWDEHPLALLDESGQVLLSQSGNGTFDDDPAVNAVSEQEMLSFTLTPALAEAVTTYVCTVHTSSMQGPVAILQQPDPVPGQTAQPNDLNSDGWYRDTNGDGTLSVTDLQVYFEQISQNRESEYVQRNLALFDYNDDRQITLEDVRILLSDVVESDPSVLKTAPANTADEISLETVLGEDFDAESG